MKKKILGTAFALLLCAGTLRAQDYRHEHIAPNRDRAPISISQKPDMSDAMQYVSANGRDSNDGLSPGTAKRTWDAACQALPGGNASPPTCGSGRIKVMSTVAASSASANYGRWLMSPTDPNYHSPPAGWERLPAFGAIVTECAGGAVTGAHGVSGNCTVSGGSTTSSAYPGIWISGGSRGFEDDHISTQNYILAPALIGVCSDRSLGANCGSQSVWLNGFSNNFGRCKLGGGPGIRIGSNSFWIYIDKATPSGCVAEDYTGSIRRTGKTVTFTTTSTNDLGVGMWVTVTNATDATFDGSFLVTAVSGFPQTVVQWTQTAADSTSAAGDLFSEKSQAIALDPGSGGDVGDVYIRQPVFSDGGVFAVGGPAALVGLYLSDGLMEGNPLGPTPPGVLVPFTKNGNAIIVENMQMADNANAPPTVEVDGACSYGSVLAIGNTGTIRGCVNLPNSPNSTLAAIEAGAASASPARLFGPTAVRYQNLATVSPASWSYDSGSGMIASGIAAPDGTSDAGQVSSSSGTSYVMFYRSYPVRLHVGDTFGWTVWVRSVAGNGYVNGQPIEFALNGHGYGAGNACSTDTVNQSQGGYPAGDGTWIKLTGICKVAYAPSVKGFVGLLGRVDTRHTTQYYAPTLIDIPAGTLGDGEAQAIISSLIPYAPSCAVGTICGLNVPFVLPGVPRTVYNKPSKPASTNISAVTMVGNSSAEHDYLDAWTVSLAARGAGCTGNTTVDLEAIFTDPQAASPTAEILRRVTLAASSNGTVGFVASGTENILAKSGTAVQYATANYRAGSGCKSNPSYVVTHTMEQLW